MEIAEERNSSDLCANPSCTNKLDLKLLKKIQSIKLLVGKKGEIDNAEDKLLFCDTLSNSKNQPATKCQS